MKKFVYLFIILSMVLSFTLIYAEDAKEETKEKPRVAVMDLDAKGVTSEEAEAVADFLRTDLLNTEKFTVIERSRVKDVLKEQSFGMSGVTDTEKATKIGKLLNCKLIIVGTLSKLGAKYFLNVRAVDVETGETKLGKRESTPTLEELSEVSQVIAQQLAGMKVVFKSKYRGATDTGATTYTGDQEQQIEYNNPPVGFDVQVGLSPMYSRYYSQSIPEIYNYELTQKSFPSFFDIQIGGYFSYLYVGLINKVNTVKKGEKIDQSIDSDSYSTNTSFDNGYDYTIGFTDLLIGFRLFRPGQLEYGVIYFSWKTVKFDNAYWLEPKVYSGPCFGMMAKIGGGNKGCCSFGKGDAPVGLFMDFGFNISLLSYKEPAGYTGDPITGVGFGGELGFGVMLRKIGLYALVNYNLDALVYTYTYKSGYTSYDVTIANIMHGVEIRVGYTFDLQTLFH